MPGWIMGLLIAAAILALAVWLAARTWKWKDSAERGEGKVVEFVRERDGERAPVIEFQTREGETVQYRVNTSSMFSSFSVGDLVPVYYDPDDPQRARVARFSHIYALPLILFWVAIAAAAVAMTKHPEVIERFPVLG